MGHGDIYNKCAGKIIVLCALCFSSLSVLADTDASQIHYVKDTINTAGEANPKAANMLKEIGYAHKTFSLTVSDPDDLAPCDRVLRFASPRPAGIPVNDVVFIEWYQARDQNGKIISQNKKCPAVLVLHILDGRMIIARAIARGMAQQGIHAFVMHLPTYGQRRSQDFWVDAGKILIRAQQGAADARRARDAIAALHGVDGKRISLQGTSLGGFVASATMGIDDAFDKEFILLAGGDLHGMFMNGQREAAYIRRVLERDGYTGQKLIELCNRIEPTTLAHRVNPQSVFLLTARQDQVVPLANAMLLAQKLRLDPDHHLMMNADHYTGVFYLRWVIGFMGDVIHNKQNIDTQPKVGL